MGKRLLVWWLVVAMLVGACGSGDGNEGDGDAVGSSQSAPSTSGTQAELLRLASTSLGKIIVDRDGKTLYVFTKDSGGKSVCEGSCAQLWPPLAPAGDSAVDAGLDGVKVGTIQRPDGTSQVTYGGAPLYYYAKDEKAGDTNGQGVGSVWFVADAEGKPIAGSAAPATTASSY